MNVKVKVKISGGHLVVLVRVSSTQVSCYPKLALLVSIYVYNSCSVR